MKQRIEVNITKAVTIQKVKDLLTTALEGGSNYWYSELEPLQTPKGKKPSDYEFWHIDIPFEPTGLIGITDADGDEHELGFLTIKRGLETMAAKYPEHWADFLTERDDAITGDVFLQCCLFDDVIYG